MFFLIIQLYKIEYKDDIILALTSCGIQKTSIFEGQNLDKVLQSDFPLFTGLVKSEDEKERYSFLITSLLEEKEKVNEFIELLKEADIDIEKENILRIILLPVENVIDHEMRWDREDHIK
jgi:hypothetical protein